MPANKTNGLLEIPHFVRNDTIISVIRGERVRALPAPSPTFFHGSICHSERSEESIFSKKNRFEQKRVSSFQLYNFKNFFLTGFACLLFFAASAQSADTVAIKKAKHSPKKAMLYAAICPGLGQIYNKKYWKLPILYAGLGTAIYFIHFNQQQLTQYTNDLNSGKSPYTPAQLSSVITYYHHDRDLSYIIAAGIYLISIVDANVDAQMRGFNVSDDISFHITPNLIPNPMSGTMSFITGFTLVKKF